MADFLNPYFKGNDFALSSTKMSSYLIFTGPLNDFLLVTFIYFLNLIFIPTALLICIENTFWNINGHGNFVELFKKSFTLYVESGMREMTERDLEILRNEQNPSRDEFYKFIVNHYLRKFHCFYLNFTSNHCLRLLNIARPGESQARADEESASGESLPEVPGSASDSKKKFTWLQTFVEYTYRALVYFIISFLFSLISLFIFNTDRRVGT